MITFLCSDINAPGGAQNREWRVYVYYSPTHCTVYLCVNALNASCNEINEMVHGCQFFVFWFDFNEI